MIKNLRECLKCNTPPPSPPPPPPLPHATQLNRRGQLRSARSSSCVRSEFRQRDWNVISGSLPLWLTGRNGTVTRRLALSVCKANGLLRSNCSSLSFFLSFFHISDRPIYQLAPRNSAKIDPTARVLPWWILFENSINQLINQKMELSYKLIK